VRALVEGLLSGAPETPGPLFEGAADTASGARRPISPPPTES